MKTVPFITRLGYISIVSFALATYSASSIAQSTEWRVLYDTAFTMMNSSRFGRATELAEEALTVANKNPTSHQMVIPSNEILLGDIYVAKGSYNKAEPLYQSAVTAREKLLGPTHADTIIAQTRLADIYVLQGRYQQAETLQKEILSRQEKALPPGHPDIAASYYFLAKINYATNALGQADSLYAMALNMTEKATGTESIETARVLNGYALLLVASDKIDEAMDLYGKALSIWNKVGYDKTYRTAQEYASLTSNIAEVERIRGNLREAFDKQQASLAVAEIALGPDHPDVANSLNNIGAIYYANKNYVDAERSFRRAQFILERNVPPDHPDLLSVRKNLLYLYQVTNQIPDKDVLPPLAKSK